MKLYTKTGDLGETGLMDGQRVPKDHLRVDAYGDVDETNAVIGLAMASIGDPEMAAWLGRVQSDLFDLGAELARPGGDDTFQQRFAGDVERLERWIDAASGAVDPLRNFILPGGGEAAARLHLARTVCRRAERRVVGLARGEQIHGLCVVYLNRLSDLLFALARQANQQAGVGDVLWISSPKGPT